MNDPLSPALDLPRCQTCPHWRAVPAARALTQVAVGECRKGPPPRDFAWPRTTALDGCGAHPLADLRATGGQVSAAGHAGGVPAPAVDGAATRSTARAGRARG